ncbi:hypothetical protein LCM20_07045 [Halobacillus litoralis]|uniref:hypothetical protein n=1 Tax=Halobacillus litoralis TaxID=45668 RepID=UPI001CD67283|nr:hypothetical protein [Halobacillus litoralis]MCA0970340.1 hypothetical protein [Halobacillus litoralis]
MKRLKLLIFPVLVVLLSGCLYPNAELKKNQVPNQVQLESIQHAVEQFQTNENGLLPIKTKPQETPIFQKYLLDFDKLKQRALIGELPGTSFENGGYYQYVIIHPETDPTVKVLDLRTTEALRSLQVKSTFYQQSHQYPPFGDQIAKGVYELDHSKLGLDEPPMIDSPYSEQMLPVYLNANGEVLIDYRKDLYAYLNEKDHDYQTGDDIRYLLTDYAPFVPGYSEEYTVEGGEPIFMSEH